MTTDKFDTIIIGSGVSGMTAGITLAKEGEQVLVLEQHQYPGGLTQTYKRKGLTFPTGVHRLGSLNPGQPLWYYFNYLGLMDHLDLVPLSQDCFEAFHFPGMKFQMPQGHDACVAKLVGQFPDQEKPIAQYFKDIKILVDSVELYHPGKGKKTDFPIEPTTSLDDYFSKLGIKGKLKQILSANGPLYGLPSSDTPILTHFLVSDSYLNSSYRINETKTPLARALVRSLELWGGQIRTKSRVHEILVKDQIVQGVRLDTGQALRAGKIIYSGHPSLLPDLCPPKVFRPVYQKRLLNAQNTPGIFGVGIQWEKKDCPVANNDAYIYDTWDVNAHYNQNTQLKTIKPGMIFLSALPGKEPMNNNQTNGNESLAVTALIGISGQDTRRLGQSYAVPGKKEYRETKAMLTEKTMEQIYRRFPQAKTQAKVIDTYSPSTFERYTLTRDGSAYGIKKTARDFLQGMFSPATRVKNLFLTGQSIGFNGIHGSISTSINLCRGFYNGTYLMDKIRETGRENQ